MFSLDEMNLVPSSKGLFSGVLKFSFQDTTMQDNNSDQTGYTNCNYLVKHLIEKNYNNYCV